MTPNTPSSGTPQHPLSPVKLSPIIPQSSTSSSSSSLASVAPLFQSSEQVTANTTKTTSSSSPLFPASPKENSFEGQLSSQQLHHNTLSSSSPSGSPSLGHSATLHRDQDTASLRSRKYDQATTPPNAPIILPRHVILPSPPHLLSSANLTQLLPVEQLVALVQALSAQAQEYRHDLARVNNEAQVLEALALGKGAGRGEIDRARVRARADARVDDHIRDTASTGLKSGPSTGEWRMELLRPPDTEPQPRAVEASTRAYRSRALISLLLTWFAHRSCSIWTNLPMPSPTMRTISVRPLFRHSP